MKSPYEGIAVENWLEVTQALVKKHPLSTDEIIEVVITSWTSIFASRMGSRGFRIGVDIFPKPQIMGFFLHELIPLELGAKYPGIWRGEENAADKDIIYIPNDFYSIEVKTSSDRNHIFGNRSYAQATSKSKKAKSGYYIAVNFEKFTSNMKNPSIRLIRFGWLDSDDWIGQKAQTGQQARLPTDVEKNKLLNLYKKS